LPTSPRISQLGDTPAADSSRVGGQPPGLAIAAHDGDNEPFVVFLFKWNAKWHFDFIAAGARHPFEVILEDQLLEQPRNCYATRRVKISRVELRCG